MVSREPIEVWAGATVGVSKRNVVAVLKPKLQKRTLSEPIERCIH